MSEGRKMIGQVNGKFEGIRGVRKVDGVSWSCAVIGVLFVDD